MNSTIYLFGAMSGGGEVRHYQFPDDYSSSIFQNFASYANEDPLLGVSFNKSLTYHVYCKRVVGGYVGFGVVLNSCWIESAEQLLAVFENAYSELVTTGEILVVNAKGYVQSNASAIIEDVQSTIVFTERLRESITTLSSFVHKMPSVDVSTSPTAVNRLPNKASDEDWIKNAGKYRNTYSYYGKSQNSINKLLEQLQGVIRDRENKELECVKLESRIEEINRQKKQYLWVIILSVAMFIGAMIAIFVVSDKNKRIKYQLETIQDNEETISQKNKNISELNYSLNDLEDRHNSLKNKYNSLKEDYNTLNSNFSDITSTYPLKITDIQIGNTYYNGSIETNYGNTLYSSQTMYLKPKIYYKGYASGSYNLKVKWYKPSGEISRGDGSPTGYSQSESVYIYSGSDNTTLRGWGNSSKGNWSSGTYRIEVWYNGICLKSKTFTIY